ncbi:MAG TPA: hypothetical protein VL422_08310 [Miltoncostaea sp.]|nr:hypothetical protein [Miltoncostaea sp.]
MYNIILMAHRPEPGRASGRPRSLAPQPVGLSHATMIAGLRASAAPRRRWRRRAAAAPATPAPGSG